MPENDQGLAALLEHASADDRICPLPGKWDEFWKLIGVPPDLKPLILSGWAFSTDREKRERFREQITYAATTGNFATAKNFIEALEAQEWHCNGGDLDWSYGDAILAEAEERKRALTAAREHYERLAALADDSAAFNRDTFAETLFMYGLFAMDTEPGLAEALRSSLKHFDDLTIENEVSLLEDTQSSVVAALLSIRKAKEIELRMLEIIDCITLAGGTVDRGSVDSFVEDMFAELPTVIAQEHRALPLTEHVFFRPHPTVIVPAKKKSGFFRWLMGG